MIRNILVLIFIFVIYYALRTVFRSAREAYHTGEKQDRLRGEEMVLDPECHTYVVKARSTALRIGGKSVYFCSETCAKRYEVKKRN
jgi:YHS domain-containing protein